MVVTGVKCATRRMAANGVCRRCHDRLLQIVSFQTDESLKQEYLHKVFEGFIAVITDLERLLSHQSKRGRITVELLFHLWVGYKRTRG